MTETEFHFPTHDEIDDRIRAARRMRAEALSGWMAGALRWLTHPRFGYSHA